MICIMTLNVPGEQCRPCGLQSDSSPAVTHPTLGTHSKGLVEEEGLERLKIAKAGETVRVKVFMTAVVILQRKRRGRGRVGRTGPQLTH